MDRQLAVLQAHDHAVFRLGGNLKTIRQARPVDDQGVIAGRVERAWQSLEHTLVRMGDRADLAVHRHRPTGDLATEGLSDRLQPEANAKHGNLPGGALDQLQADAGTVRIARTGRKHNTLRVLRHHLVGADLVIPVNNHLHAQ